MARLIGCTVAFDWDFNGAYTDESTNLVQCSGSLRFAPPGESMTGSQGIVDRCTIELRNTAGRYSPLNTGGALYATIQAGGAYHVPVRVETTIDGSTYYRIFTGVAKVPKETGRAVDNTPTVTFDCRSRDEIWLNQRLSTTQTGFAQRNQDGYTEAQTINVFLTAAGVTGQAVDAGLIAIPWSYMDDESVIEEAWQIAAACGGRFYFDASGTPRYENMAHWLYSPHVTSQQTYTADDWQRLRAEYDDANLYSEVTVEYAGRLVDLETVLWEPDEEVIIPASSTKTLTATFQYPSYTVPDITWRAHTIGGTEMTASVTVTPTYSAQRAEIEITNAHATLSARIVPFQVTGRGVVGGPSAEVTKTSAADGANGAFWATRGTARTKRVSGNYYVQTKAQANMIAQFLLDRFERPALTYTLEGVPGNPQRVPGDRITVNDSSVMSSAREAMVVAVDWRYGGMAYTQDIEAVDATSLYPYLGTTPGYFVIGVNELGAADPQRGRVFY